MNFDAILVGLGNPGPRYAFTRHNVGFISLDLLAQEQNQKFSASSTLARATHAEVAKAVLRQKTVLLFKPQTFMNLSGESLAKLYAQQGHLRQVPLIVVHDEVEIPLGKIRVKKGGGDAGHNGLKSLRASIGNGDFYRVRLGVGRPDPASTVSLADHVLRNFEKSEEKSLIEMLSKAVLVFEALVEDKLNEAQTLASK
jgi:PTH1 family peptidyl-tRNA hydrolase